MRAAKKGGAAAFAAAPPLWGAEGSFAGLTANVPEAGIIGKTEKINTKYGLDIRYYRSSAAGSLRLQTGATSSTNLVYNLNSNEEVVWLGMNYKGVKCRISTKSPTPI